MPDTIGDISVPEVAASGTFPLVTDWGFERRRLPEVAVHRFGSANYKIEQRFLLGDGLTRYTVTREALDDTERASLEAFWAARQGVYQPFTYNVPDEDGEGTTPTTVRFENAPLSVAHLSDAICSTGVVLVEVPQSFPSYTLNDTLDTFPDSALETALLEQVQVVIPLLKITVRETGYPVIYISDRRCTIGGQLYQARLLRFDGISQAMNGAADDARFILGNADRVIRDLANDTRLERATLEFSMFHVGEGVKVDRWKGEVVDHSYDSGPEFLLVGSDPYELTLEFPERIISDRCWKEFDGADLSCPWTAEGSGSFTECDKSWTDCESRGMDDYFGGITLAPQNVRIRETGAGIWGFGRKLVTRASQVNETIIGEPLQHVYTSGLFPHMMVDCLIAAGRDEEDFYSALGIVGAGPIKTFSYDGLGHRLDGLPVHGDEVYNLSGLRRGRGNDPVEDADPDSDSKEFSLSATGGGFTGERAAGVAFLEMKREDEPGLQLSKLSDHEMRAKIESGLGGWKWDVAGVRSFSDSIINPVWIFINAVLRTAGLYLASEATQETVFDWPSAYAAADLCDDVVAKVDGFGGGSEVQFQFGATIRDRRPLRDWALDILANCLGYFYLSNGKIKVGLRMNSSAVEAFTTGNIIADSLTFRAAPPSFTSLEAYFANSQREWKEDMVEYRDEDAAREAGGGSVLRWTRGQITLLGTPTPSQAARIAITRGREELGGITAAERLAHREVSLRTTILALAVEPGMVVSVTHADAPGGAIEFRVRSWKLLPDWSVQIEGKTTVDSMYDWVNGPKPADVSPDPVPAERVEDLLPIQPWFPHHEQPAATDPLYDQTDWQFYLEQRFEVGADGATMAKLRVKGRYPITTLITDDAPVVGVYSTATTGGSIASGAEIAIALVALDSSERSTRAATPTIITVDVGTGTNKITLSSITWPASTVGYRLYAGADRGQLSLQGEQLASQPASIDLTSVANVRTYGLPQPQSKTLRVRVKFVEHDGVSGLTITGVAANTITAEGIGWTPDEWIGRTVSVISDETDGSATIWNFLVTDNDDETLTVTPDPYAAGVDALDVLIIRTLADTFSASTIGDSMFENAQYPDGANPDEEIGRQVRIIHGTGKGQVRRIISNTSTVLTIEGEWATTPDATSIFVVEQAAWEYEADIRDLPNSVVDGNLSFDLPVGNFLSKTMLVEVATISNLGAEPARRYNSSRSIYIYGQFGGERVAATFGIDGAALPGDDLGPRRLIQTDELGIPLTLRMNGKEVLEELTMDFEYSSDQGETWTSIFYAEEFRPTLPVGEDVEIQITGFDPDAYFEAGGWLRQSVISGSGVDIESVIEFGLPFGFQGQYGFQDYSQSAGILTGL